MMSENSNTGHETQNDTPAPQKPGQSSDLIGNAIGPSDVAPPKIQPGEKQDPSETQGSGRGGVSSRTPLISTLNECLPKGSTLRGSHHPYLDRGLDCGPEVALKLHKNGLETDMERQSPEGVWAQLDGTDAENAIIVVENIDDTWCDALCARYPNSTNERFLSEHILGFTLELVDKAAFFPRPIESTPMKADIRGIERALARRANNLSQTGGHGFHVSYWYEMDRGPEDGYYFIRGDCVLQWRKSGWITSNAFVSCCRLEKIIYLVLLTPRFNVNMHQPASNGQLCISHTYSRSTNKPATMKIPPCLPWDLTTALLNSLDSEWPVFVWKLNVNGEDAEGVQSGLDCYLLAMLLTTSALRSGVHSAKEKMISLAYLNQHIDDHGHLAELIRFRRNIGRLHHAITQRLTTLNHTFYTAGVVHLQYVSATQSPSRASPQEVFRNQLSELQATLNATKAGLNEELQVAVGAVQVQDAQVTKTQTNMTVVLTILAALYLPMTLVTGIFGMNIAEINRTANCPKAWLAVVAWLVSIVLTAGSGFLIWKVWKLWTARKARKQSDIEIGYESGDSDLIRSRPKQD